MQAELSGKSIFLLICTVLQTTLHFAADDQDLSALTAPYQNECMRNFATLEGVDPQHLAEDAYCEFHGITCVDRIVRGISWTTPRDAEIRHFRWIPPTLRFLNFNGVKINQVLDTRDVPRKAHLFRLDHAQASGTLELQVLPPAIIEFRARYNAFDGELLLTNLPPKIVFLDVHENLFWTIVIDNSALPESLFGAYCGFNGGRHQANVLNGGKRDGRVELGATGTYKVDEALLEVDFDVSKYEGPKW